MVAIFISAAICQSVIAVGISPSKEDYWPHLWQRVDLLWAEIGKPGFTPEKKKELELLLWAENKLTDTEKMFAEDWNASRLEVSGADPKFREIVTQHANLLLDQASYSNAIDDYKMILQRDRSYNPGKINVGIDLNNLGVAYQLLAISSNDTKTRVEACTKSIEYYKLAEEEFRKKKDDDALFNNLANQYGLLHEMQDKKQARSVFAELRKVNTQPTKNFREMVLEQQ